MTQIYFPFELHEEILVHLAEEKDYNSLASYAGVCRAVYSLAQQHFFRRVVLWCRHREHRSFDEVQTSDLCPANFVKLLDRSPHIADFVEDLELWMFWTLGPGYGKAVNANFDDLQKILPRLKNLSSIALPDDFDRGVLVNPEIRWQALFPEFRSLLLKTFSLDNVRSIDVRSIRQFPVHELSRTTPLDRLALGWINPIVSSLNSSPVVALRVNILSLRASNPAEFVEDWKWLSHADCGLDKPSVRQLGIRYSMSKHGVAGPPAVDEIFKLLPNVYHLHFVPPFDEMIHYTLVDAELQEPHTNTFPPRPVPTLALLRRLRSLTFEGNFYSTTYYGAPVLGSAFVSCINALPDLLGTLSRTSNRIEHIRIIIAIDPQSSLSLFIPSYIEDPPPLSRWSDIVDILLSPLFPSLRRVDMDISAPDWVPMEKQARILNVIKSHPDILRLKASTLLL